MKIIRKVSFAFFLMGNICCFGQVLKPISWVVETSKSNPKKGEVIEILFQAKIEKDWYLYSSDFDPDLGPMLSEFHFKLNDTYQTIDSIIPVNPLQGFDSIWMGNYTYFKDFGLFKQRVQILDKNFKISGYYTYQVCSDVDGKCIPFEEEFSLGAEIVLPKNDLPEESTTKKGYFTIWLTALFAGLAALLTPCVYPMIPITVSVFLKQSKTRREGISKALLFGISIIIFFCVLGFVISWLWGFASLNVLSTHWLFNMLIFIMFILFALSFFGLFEISLPTVFINKIDRQADKGGWLGIFFMAVTLVLVSFSCTFPIVGTALIQTLNGGSLVEGILSMFGFSLAFAIPFTAFAIFPTWLKSLPSSGGWLQTIKVVLGFLELALALKFLSVADLAYHWGILDREVFIAIWLAIFITLGFYLLGKIQLTHENTKNKVSVGRLMLFLGVFAFVIHLIPGLWGAPLKTLSGFLPPMSTHNFNILEKPVGGAVCTKPLHADILKLPHGLLGYFDYDQALDCAKEQGKPLFIDFTGHGCVNCREMEQRVWADPIVLDLLKNQFVVAALYVDDRTQLSTSQWYRSTYDNKFKRTIGQQNADIQITKFNNNAQPFYIIMDGDGNLLAGPKAYDLNIPNFVSFLNSI